MEFDETKLTVDQIIKAANAIGYHPEIYLRWKAYDVLRVF